MKNLFIIGNGFDCYAHGLPTMYSDFREFLISKYPGADEYDEIIPEAQIGNHGEEIYQMTEVAGYISRIIDDCGKADWKDLETYLGEAIFNIFLDDLEAVDMDAPEIETMRAIHYNESLSYNIEAVFSKIKLLFCDWVNSCLGLLDYDDKRKDNIAEVISDGDAFLSFNYTMTLEKVYGIRDVCHIHGKIGDSEDDIFFGHGDDDEYPESIASFGADVSLNTLKRKLRKDTQSALARHGRFFDSLGNVTAIHSFGFSFSRVDMVYIEKIARIAPGAVWYLNKFDATENENRAEIIRTLNNLGFVVKVDTRW